MPKISANKNEIAKAATAIVLSIQIIQKTHPIILIMDLTTDTRKCLTLLDSCSSGIYYCLLKFLTIDLSLSSKLSSFLSIFNKKIYILIKYQLKNYRIY